MVLITTLKTNFNETTKDLNIVAKWVVKIVLLGIVASGIALLIGVAMNGAPNIAFIS